MIYGKFISLVLASSLLVACNEGGLSGTDDSSIYTGKRELATLDVSNQNTFVEGLLFSVRDMWVTAVASGSAVMNVSKQVDGLNRYQARAIDPIVHGCDGGGFQTTTGRLEDDTINPNTLRITSSQCNENGMIINGVVDLIINGYDFVDDGGGDNYIDLVAITSNLLETINGVTYTVSGNVYFSTDDGETKIISNLVRKASTSIQQLDDNIQLISGGSNESISGGFCEGVNGCVSIVATDVSPQAEIVMTGANNSRIKIYRLDDQTWVGVDADGDGTYETNTPYTDPF